MLISTKFQGVSLYAKDKTTNQMIGIATAVIANRTDKFEHLPSLTDLRQNCSEAHANTIHILDSVFNAKDFFDAHPDCHKIFCLTSLALLSEYRRKGIAGKLVQHSLKVCNLSG